MSPTFDFPELSVTEEKELAVSSLFEQKSEQVSKATFEKQQKAGVSTDFLLDRLQQEQAAVSVNPEDYTKHLTNSKETLPEAFGRGVGDAVDGVPMLGYGVAAGAGAVAESVLGEGGFATQFKEGAVKKYTKAQEDMAEYAEPEDSLTHSYQKAKEGDLGAMLSWASHGTGYVAAQLATMLTGAGVVEKGVELTGKKAVSQLMGTLVKREAAKIAEKTLVKKGAEVTAENIAKIAAADSIQKAATSIITRKVGQHIGMAGMGFGMEGGEIMGDLAHQSVEEGKALTGKQIGKGLTATALAGAVEYLETVLGLKALKGKMGNIPGTKIADGINGVTGRIARGAVSGAKIAPAEAVQEFTQTGIEQWGKGQDLTSEEAKRERIDAAGLGALGGGPATVGGTLHGSKSEKEISTRKRREKDIVNAEATHGFKEKVSAAAETGDVSQYTDLESKEFSPVTAMNALHERAQKEELSSLDKLKTRDDAVELYTAMNTQRISVMKEAEALENKENPTEEDQDHLDALLDRAATLTEVMTKTGPMLQSMQKTEEPAPELLDKMKAVFEENNNDGINEIVREVFGSNGGISFIDENSDSSIDLDSLMAKANLDESTSQLLKNIVALKNTAQAYIKETEKPSKTTEAVKSDIVHGNTEDGFMGISQHIQGVSIALTENNPKLAQSKQTQLENWAEQKENRAQVFKGMYDSAVAGKEPAPAIQSGFDAINRKQKESGKKPYFINTNSRGLVNNIIKEAAVVRQAAVTGQDLIALAKPQNQTQWNGKVANAASPSATADTSIPAHQTSDKAVPEAEDAPSTKTKKSSTPTAKKQGVKEAQVKFMITLADKKNLKAMGFRESEIRKMKPAMAGNLLKYQGKSLDQLIAAGRKAGVKSTNRDIIKKAFLAKRRLESEAKKKTEPRKPQRREDVASKPDPKEEVQEEKSSQVTEETKPINELLTAPETKLDVKDLANINKINTLREFGQVNKEETKTIFNQFSSVLGHLKDRLKLSKSITADEKKAISSIIGFQEKFSKSLGGVFKYKKNTDYHYEDPTNYFAVEGELPENVVSAMATVAYRWLASEGNNTTFNDENAIRRILGLKSSMPVSREAKKLLTTIGNTSDYLGEGLGREVFNYLQIQLNGNAPANLQNKIERSLGMLMLVNMQRMGHLKRTYVDYGTVGNTKADQATTGLKGLANKARGKHDNKITAESFFVEKLQGNHRKSKKVIHFFTVKTLENFKPTKKNKEVRDNFKQAKPIWESIFELPKDKKELSFGKITSDNQNEQMPLTRSQEKASVEQTSNIKNNMDTPFVLAGGLMNILTVLSVNDQKKIMGSKEKVNSHADNDIRVDGVNTGIDRSYEQILSWFSMAAKQPKKFASEFFVPAVFQANNRMRQVGTIQPQNDKIHRALFSMKDAHVELDPTDETLVIPLMEAVGLSFGIEASKEQSIDDVVTKTNEFLKDSKITPALDALDQILDLMEGKNDFSFEVARKAKKKKINTQALITAVKEGGEDLHSLKGLLEYQKYIRAQKEGKPFTTDIFAERDGMANGPIMMTLQLRTSEITPDLLGRLMSGGMVFQNDENRTDSDHKKSYDPYESIGVSWGNRITEVKQELALAVKDGKMHRKKALQAISQIDAISSLLGGLYTQEGYLAKSVRKLAKNMSVGAVYGAEKASTVRGLTNHIIEDIIYGTLEKIANTEDQAEANTMRRQLFDTVNILSGQKNSFTVPSKISKKHTALHAQLTPQAVAGITANIKKHYGEALYEAIEDTYGDFKEASKPLNKGIGILAARYNAAMRILLKQIGGPVTKKQLKEIHKKLQPILPRVKTPIGGHVALYDFVGSEELPSGDDTQLQQYYLNEGLKEGDEGYVAGIKAEARDLKMIKEPGVKPIPTIIHMLDSMVANSIMGAVNGIGILNIHDAAITGLHDAEEVSLLQNEAFFDIMKNYSVAGTVQEALEKAGAAFKELDLGVDQKEIDQAIWDAYDSFGYTIEKGSKKKLTKGAVEANNWRDVKDVATKTQENKETLLNAVTYSNQYFDYRGGFGTGNEAQAQVGKVKTNDIVPQTAFIKTTRANKNVETIKSTQELVDELTSNKGLSSKADSSLSLDPIDYAIEREINNQNVLGIYNNIKNDSSIKDNVTHDKHLQRILGDLVSMVMRPLDGFMKVNPYSEAEGAFVHNSEGKGQVFISSQAAAPVSGALNQGIRMSTGEVYTHELLHTVLHSGLKMNHHLRQKVSTLYRVTYKKLAEMYPGEEFRVFLNDSAMDVKDPANQYDVEAAKERYDYIFRNPKITKKSVINPATGVETTKEYSNHLDEFITFGLTNENFMEALKEITLDNTEYAKSTWAGLKGANIQQTLMNIGQKIFQFFRAKFTDIPNSNVVQEIEQLAFQLSRVDSANKTKLFEKARKYVGYFQKISDFGNGFIKKVFTKTPVLKIANNLKKGAEVLKENDDALGQSIRDMIHKYQSLNQGFIKSTITEIRGRTDRLAPLHQLLTRRKLFLDSAKETATASYKEVAQKLFKKELLDEEKAVLTKAGLRTDASILLDSLKEDGLLKVFKDPKALKAEIIKVMGQIKADPDLAPHALYYERASSALGHFMVHSRSRTDEVVFLSPRVIAEMKNTPQDGSVIGKEADKAEALIDQLASLYAVQNTAKKQKEMFVSLMEEDSDAVTGVLRMHKTLKADALKYSFNDNKYLFRKGYTKQILNTQISFQYGTLEEKAELEAAAFTKSDHPISRDPLDPTRNTKVFVYTAKTGRINDLLSTIMSFTRNRAAGTDSRQVAMQLDMDTHQGAQNTAKIIKSKQHVLDLMADPRFAPQNVSGNHMVPRLDRDGNIVEYRYMMAETTKDSYLEQVNDYDAILGAMAGQIVDKGHTPEINRELVFALKAMYDGEYKNNPAAYTEIGPASTDPELRELYYMFPEKTKKDIKLIWKNTNGSLFVAKDVLALAFGYRKYSIVEAFTKKPKERAMLERIIVTLFNSLLGEKKGIVAANNAEMLAGELTQLAKDNIIVKSLSVTMRNFGSNLMYLRARGVGIASILKYGREAVIMGTKYQADEQKLNQLGVERKILVDKGNAAARIKDIDIQITQLKDALSRNPIQESIKSGLMPSLVDDFDTAGSNSHFPGQIESFINKHTSKLPSVIKKVGGVAFLTQDTQAYKVLNNAVKMTDFVGRHILFNHYIKNGGMDQAEAAAKAIDEFVNFDVPTHKITEYFNQIGLVHFSKYTTRILKSIAGSIKDKPFDVAMSIILTNELGFDSIYNSVPLVTSDIGNKFGTPVTMLGSSVDDIGTLSVFDSILR